MDHRQRRSDSGPRFLRGGAKWDGTADLRSSTSPLHGRKPPRDRHLTILETESYFDDAAGLAYFFSRYEDKAQALLLAKCIDSDPEPALWFAGAAALEGLHCEGSRDAV
jgi:hypothetical protein